MSAMTFCLQRDHYRDIKAVYCFPESEDKERNRSLHKTYCFILYYCIFQSQGASSGKKTAKNTTYYHNTQCTRTQTLLCILMSKKESERERDCTYYLQVPVNYVKGV